MSRFNVKKAGTKTVNRAGGEAYKQSPELALVSLLLTSFIKDQYYRSAQDQMDDLINLSKQVDPKFAAKAAIYARNEFGMRSITHLLAASIAKNVSGNSWGREFYNRVVFRPDDMMEILSVYGVKPLTNAMRKGFKDAFNRFDGYQLAKYRHDGKEVSLIDVVNLVHPVPTDRNVKALKELVDGTLRNTQTWEAKLSASQGNKESKAKAWNDLLSEGKLGYLALIRNLRNILEQAPEAVNLVCEQLVIRDKIKKSKVFPFQLLTAYKQLTGANANTRKVLNALGDAIEISCDNVPDFPNTLVAIDNSGSMWGTWGAAIDNYQNGEIGALFGIILGKKSNADVMEFGNYARYISYTGRTDVMKFAQDFKRNNKVGHGTNFSSIFDNANKAYDRVVIFSDMQGWIGYYSPVVALNTYKAKYNCNPYIYSIDLAGYGDMQFPKNNVFVAAGFSHKIFDLMKMFETDRQAMVNEIKKIEI